VVRLNVQITLAQSNKGGSLLNRVRIQVLQLELAVVKDEFIRQCPESTLVKSNETNHIPRRAGRFPLITGNNPLQPIRVDVGGGGSPPPLASRRP
jgi:hypothetical protein